MRFIRQSGFSLIETMMAAALVTVGLLTIGSALAVVARYSAHNQAPMRAAAQILAEQTLRVAADAWKYGAPALSSRSWTTRLLVKSAAAQARAVPAAVTVTLNDEGFEGTVLHVRITYTPEASARHDDGQITMSEELAPRSPVPGSTILVPGLVPAPQLH